MTIALIAIRLAEFLFRCDRTRTKSLIAADLSVRFKCRSDLPAALRESNYSIYSINGGFEERPRGISGLGCLVSTPLTHKSIIDKRRLTSQAGRRRYAAGKCGLNGGNCENRCPLALFREIPPCSTVGGLSGARILPSASRMSLLDPSVWLKLITV